MRVMMITFAAMVAALTACGQPTQPISNPVPVPPPAPLTFGQSHTWPTGDTITIGTPQRKSTTSPYSGRVDTYIVVPVSVHNGSQGILSGDKYFTQVTIDDVPTTYMAMPGDPLIMNRTASVLPDKTLKWDEAYPVNTSAPVHFQMQVMGAAFDPSRPVVFFEGTA